MLLTQRIWALTFFIQALLARAQTTTSFLLPSIQPQPLVGEVMGVSKDGHTIWKIQKDKEYSESSDSGLDGTITLVQGDDDMYMAYDSPSEQRAVVLCDLGTYRTTSAICVEGQHTTTLPYDPISVRVASTAAPLMTPVVAAGAIPSGTEGKNTTANTSSGSAGADMIDYWKTLSAFVAVLFVLILR